MWIIGNCTSDQECGSAKTFNASSSSSILVTENPYKIQYGRGTASGHVAHDNVSVGGQMANAAFGMSHWHTAFTRCAADTLSPR